MTTNIALIVIMAVSGLVLVISLLKKKTEIFLNFIMRVVTGAIAIYFINEFLSTRQFGIAVGLNPLTLCTVGTLGVTGVALLYGVLLYKFL